MNRRSFFKSLATLAALPFVAPLAELIAPKHELVNWGDHVTATNPSHAKYDQLFHVGDHIEIGGQPAVITEKYEHPRKEFVDLGELRDAIDVTFGRPERRKA